ncbi:MAG: heat-inducible transcription repressor HrcA [SAR202 cluster bacterium]|nr:heat-inducible transcription repressor HrcA [SAR202 cluster bacterium]
MLTERQAQILKIIVGDYIRTAVPIASDSIAKHHDLGVSSATIRNEVARLEAKGYISRPHLSAGSVPLDNGYRLYVEAVLGKRQEAETVDDEARTKIRRRLLEAEREAEDWAGAAADILAQLVGNMAVTTFPKAREPRIKHVEIVPIQDMLALLIVVLEQARVRKQLIRLKSAVTPVEMEASANRIKQWVSGLTRHEIKALQAPMTPLETEVMEAAASILEAEDKGAYSDHFVNGLRNLLRQPEFAEGNKARAVVEGVEDGSLIQAILSETPDGGVVRVIIGQEHSGDNLWPLSVVVCQYGIPGSATGAIGAVGPTRMEYLRAISSVRLVSSLMTELVSGVDK